MPFKFIEAQRHHSTEGSASGSKLAGLRWRPCAAWQHPGVAVRGYDRGLARCLPDQPGRSAAVLQPGHRDDPDAWRSDAFAAQADRRLRVLVLSTCRTSVARRRGAVHWRYAAMPSSAISRQATIASERSADRQMTTWRGRESCGGWRPHRGWRRSDSGVGRI